MEMQVRRCLPEEACGFIIEKGPGQIEAVSVTNALHSPLRFRMEPGEQLELMTQMDENKRKKIEAKLLQLFTQTDQNQDANSFILIY